MHRYPTLEFIDKALDNYSRRFAESTNAADLELRAHHLGDEYWSETVRFTGRVPEAAFRAVCSALEQERATDPRVVALIVVGVPIAARVRTGTAPIWAVPGKEVISAPFANE